MNARVLLWVFGVFASGALAAGVMTWTGDGADNLWSNGANWDGTVPGSADTAVFKSGSDEVSVDVAEVKVLVLEAGFSGSLTMANDFTVRDGHYQTNGTFNCASYLYTVGLGVDGASGTSYRGFFDLIGGTFNCSTGITRWRPTNNGPVFRIAVDATWNHCGGTFEMGGPNNNNALLDVNQKTFNNFSTYGKRAGVLKGCTTNTVLGTYTSHGAGLRTSGAQNSQIQNPTQWDSQGAGRNGALAVHGDVYLDNVDDATDRAGVGVLLLCGTLDQVIHSDNGCLPTVVVDKPVGTKVTCDVVEGQKLTFYGLGSGMNPHLYVRSGKFVFPKGGVDFPNARYTDIFVVGDGDIDTSGAGLSMSIINSAWICMPNHRLGNLTIGGSTIGASSTASSICITGNLEIATGGGFAPGNGVCVPVLCGEGDQHYQAEDGAYAAKNDGSSWAGEIQIDKPSGRLFMDSPMLAQYITIKNDLHVVFPITNATDQSAAEIGEGGWNMPLFQATKTASIEVLKFPNGGTITIEPTGKITGRSPFKWNLFQYSQKVGNFDSVTFNYLMPRRVYKPRVNHDVTGKLMYLSYKVSNGTIMVVR